MTYKEETNKCEAGIGIKNSWKLIFITGGARSGRVLL